VRGGLEGGQVSPGAWFRLRPASVVALRLALGLALCLSCNSLRAQSTPTPPAQAAAPAAAAAPAHADTSGNAAPDSAGAASAESPGAAASTAGDPPAAQGTTADVNLSGVQVEGKRNVFNDNDRKLKQLQDSLPCNGCDATPHVKKKFVRRVLNAIGERVLPTETPDHTDRDPNDRAQEFSQEGACNAANVGGCVGGNLKP